MGITDLGRRIENSEMLEGENTKAKLTGFAAVFALVVLVALVAKRLKKSRYPYSR